MKYFQILLLLGINIATILFSQSIEIPHKMMNQNTTLNIPIFIYDVSNLGSIQLMIEYDESIILAEEIIKNPVGILDGGYTFTPNLTVPGIIILAIGSNSPNVFSGSGMIAQITFHSIGNLGEFSTLTILDAQINSSQVPAVDGSIEIILDDLMITGQDNSEIGADHSITLGMCEGCADGWSFGEDEYDYPNPFSGGYTNLNFYHYDWNGTIDAHNPVYEDSSTNFCCDQEEFKSDYRSQHSFRELTSWGIKGSTGGGLSSDIDINLSWDSSILSSNSDNFQMYIFVGDENGVDMQEQTSITIPESELDISDNYEPNIWVMLGGCADTGETEIYYQDFDGDGLGGSVEREFCAGLQPEGWVSTNDGDICYGEEDCLGTCNGSAYLDNCLICVDSENEECIQDCNGEWGGIAVMDNCGVCDNDPSNDCIQDCNGDWGGTAIEDVCGVCGGNGPPENYNCDLECTADVDCNGECGGSAVEDECGVCGGNGPPSNYNCDLECTVGLDCNGECGGTAVEDICGICEGIITVPTDCVCPDGAIMDCAGVCGGSAVEDECGVCGGNGPLDNYNCAGQCIADIDCDGVCGGSAEEDECLVCGGDGPPDNYNCDLECTADVDCNGECGGSAVEDECGVCNGDGIPEGDCDCEDNVDLGCGCGEAGPSGCDDVCGSTATLDKCGTCDDNSSNDCVQDCNGDWGGSAFLNENCGEPSLCVGGSTGLDCVQDCTGVWGGNAIVDDCGDCVGIDVNYINENMDEFGTCCNLVEKDICGECGGIGISEGNCDCDGNLLDCAGECGGPLLNTCIGFETNIQDSCLANDGYWSELGNDECGVCNGNNSTCTDCNGYLGGPNGIPFDGDEAYLDGCEDCVGGNTGMDDCLIDCNGDLDGLATKDNCGECDDNPDNDCTQDCKGVWGGNAIIDDCGICVGGSTGVEPCVMDCAEVLGGTFWVSDCGCVGADNSGDDCDDCSEIPNGNSYIDQCSNCIEEETDTNFGCSMDCDGVWGGTHLPTFTCENGDITCNYYACFDLANNEFQLPQRFDINRIYPNPFNPQATIDFEVSEPTMLQLNIYNLRGQKVDVLIDSFTLPGHYSVNWNGTNHPSGIYFVIMNSNQSIIRRKIILLK